MPAGNTYTQIIMACIFTGIYDVNRNNILPDDDDALIRDWAAAITEQGLKGIIFHNNFSDLTCAKYSPEHISFIRVVNHNHYNPNVNRYFIYRDYLRLHATALKDLFITDISDVVVLKNPFKEELYTDNPASLFCGDEPKQLDDEWMRAHATHLRSHIPNYADYEEKHQQETLLNCGIIGGRVGLMQDFIEQLCTIHERYNQHNQTAYTGDMGAFNYLVRTRFNERVLHGAPVNTVFKAYEDQRTDCWFRHK
jgi:hypothetical protein